MTSCASAVSAAEPRAGVHEAFDPVILGSYDVGLQNRQVWEEEQTQGQLVLVGYPPQLVLVCVPLLGSVYRALP